MNCTLTKRCTAASFTLLKKVKLKQEAQVISKHLHRRSVIKVVDGVVQRSQ